MPSRFFASVLLGCVISLSALADDKATATPQQSPQDEVAQMHWQRAGDYSLPESKSKLTIPTGYVGVFGAEARRVMQLTNATPSPQTEAVLVDKASDMVVFDWLPEGYVSSDDWPNLDANAMLQSITENGASANEERRKQHLPEIFVTGWLKTPTLDKDTDTAFWTLELRRSDNEPVINSIALRLARQGYEKITWVVDKDHFNGGAVLQTMLTANSFPIGSRYIDHAVGDKAAGYGIAALVAAVAGAKIAKAAGFVGLMVLLKKLWLIPILAGGAFWRKIKALFAKRDV